MDEAKVSTFLQVNMENLPSESLFRLRDQLLALDDSKAMSCMSVRMKSPIIALVLGLLFGSLGIDRFYIGDIGLGIGKLLTCGGLGIWTFVDWFLIMRATKERNLQNLVVCL